MDNLLFNQNFQLGILKNVETIYEDFINEMVEDVESREAQNLFSENFLQDLYQILKNPDLKKYSPLKFYWTTLIDNFVYISQLHQDLSSNINRKQNKLFQEIEEEIFDFWSDSDLVDIFKTFLEEGGPIEDCSLKSMLILEDHIISFYYLHISTDKYVDFDKTIYLPLENIGDDKEHIYIRNLKYSIKLPHNEFALLSLENLSLTNKTVELNLDDETDTCNIHETKLGNLNGHFKIVNNSNFASKFQDALDVLKLASNDLYKTVENFSEFFVPINEEGIVSYSMQSLPKFSSINVFERDFLDLVDDISHENGHHYLNAILNQEDLLNEDDEKIYFSPWRKSLRPIRGIYHGTFTFYFALKLYTDLKKSITKPEIQSIIKKHHELKFAIKKIHQRIIEEHQMLNQAKLLINHAYKAKKVTDRGLEVITWIFKLIDETQGDYTDSISELKKDKSNDTFFETLKEYDKQAKHYSL